MAGYEPKTSKLRGLTPVLEDFVTKHKRDLNPLTLKNN